MKHYLSLFLLTVLLFTSCQSGLREIETEPVVDTLPIASDDGTVPAKPGYSYLPSDDRAVPRPRYTQFNNNLQYDNGLIYIISGTLPYRFNPETGYITLLCSDPLCKHFNYDCCQIIDNENAMVIRDNKCYFRQRFHTLTFDEITGDRKVTSEECYAIFDMETTNTGRLCFDCYENAIMALISGNSKFHVGYVDPDNRETSPKGIFMVDLATDKHTLVKEFEFGKNGSLMFADNEYLYYRKGLEIWRMSLSDPKEDHKIAYSGSYDAYCDDEYIYLITNRSEGEGIVRFKKDGTGEIEELVLGEFDSSHTFCMTEDYIYYRTGETKVYAPQGTPPCVGDFYRIPKEGGEPELVFDVTEEFSETTAIMNYIVDGNYIYATFMRFDPAAGTRTFSYQNRDGAEILRINMVTKEVDYISSQN